MLRADALTLDGLYEVMRNNVQVWREGGREGGRKGGRGGACQHTHPR